MDLTDKHPAELDFHKMITEVTSLLERYESQYLYSDDRDALREGMEEIKDKLFNLQMERLSNHINDKGKLDKMPKEEEEIQKEMTELTKRINTLLNSD